MMLIMTMLMIGIPKTCSTRARIPLLAIEANGNGGDDGGSHSDEDRRG